MAAAEIYLKVSGKYYPCEPKKAWLRKHLPVQLWVWRFERKLLGVKWQLFVSWNMTWPITIYRTTMEQITESEMVWADAVVLDPIQTQSTIGTEWEIPPTTTEPV